MEVSLPCRLEAKEAVLVDRLFLQNKCKDNISKQNHCKDRTDGIDHSVGIDAAEPPEQGLQAVQEDHAADAEADTGIQRDPAFKIKGKAGVIPQLFSSGKLHNIAADQLYNSSDQDNTDKDEQRRDQYLPNVNALFLKP